MYSCIYAWSARPSKIFFLLCVNSEIINKMELIEVNIYIISYFGIMTSSCPKSLKKTTFTIVVYYLIAMEIRKIKLRGKFTPRELHSNSGVLVLARAWPYCG